MTASRVFFPQEALESWMAESRAHVVGETLFLEGQAFTLETAVRFLEEVAGGGDATRLVGRVKTLDQVAELGGEHCSDSVVLGDNAYQVIEGFLASPELGGPAAPGTHDRLIKLFQKQ
jgi:hypothetical protein